SPSCCNSMLGEPAAGTTNLPARPRAMLAGPGGQSAGGASATAVCGLGFVSAAVVFGFAAGVVAGPGLTSATVGGGLFAPPLLARVQAARAPFPGQVFQQGHVLERAARGQDQVADQGAGVGVRQPPQLVEQRRFGRRGEVLLAEEQVFAVVVALPQGVAADGQ